MKYIVQYRFREWVKGNDVMRDILSAFATYGNHPGTVLHWLRVDGSGGVLLVEHDDIGEIYAHTQRYTDWGEYEIIPAVSDAEAVPIVSAQLAEASGSE